MEKDNLLNRINQLPMNYDSTWDKFIKEKYCRKEETIKRQDEKFFSQYWQGFAWAAILGFINNRRSSLDSKTKSSFRFQTINNQRGYDIADALILMAIAKSNKGYQILDEPREICDIISEYAKGGAEYVNELLETPGNSIDFTYPDHFLNEIVRRKSSLKKKIDKLQKEGLFFKNL